MIHAREIRATEGGAPAPRHDACSMGYMTQTHRTEALVSRAQLAIFFAAALALVSLFAPGEARAQSYDHSHGANFELHAGYSWWGEGLALGGRLGLPFAGDGSPSKLSLTVGADFYFMHGPNDETYGAGLGVPVTLEWRVRLLSGFSLFLEGGINVFFPSGYFSDQRFDYAGAWVVLALGLEFHLSDSLSFIIRLGSPYSAIGLGFSL